MTEPQRQIQSNYQKTLDLAYRIIRKEQEIRGHPFVADDPDNLDLAQSLVGCEKIVALLKEIPFREDIYAPILEEELDELKRSLFLDINKRRVVSFDEGKGGGVEAVEYDGPEAETSPEVQADEILDFLEAKLSPDSFTYLEKLIVTTDMEWNSAIFRLLEKDPEELEKKIQQIRKFYPDARIYFDLELDVSQNLSKSIIVDLYKNVYLGISKSFPMFFLQYESRRRCAILTKFLLEEILEIDPREVVAKNDTAIFSENGLANILRYFNYSLNKTVANAYPDRIQPWENSKVPEGYWEVPEKRVSAIRWLVEEKLGIPEDALPEAIRNGLLTKKSFIDHQLSYMYNQYYNSVSRAIGEAYPRLKPWELANVPRNFWHGEKGRVNAQEAVRWMMEKEGWKPDEIPGKVSSGQLNRKTFSQLGLSTMFEKVFKKNLYQALNAAYPGRFQPWEIGNVPEGFWKDLSNAYRAVGWVKKKEELEDTSIYEAYQKGTLNKNVFQKYGLGNMIRSVFQNSIFRVFQPEIVGVRNEKVKEETRLLTKIDKRIRQATQGSRFFKRLLYGWFWKEVQRTSDSDIRKYKRMKRRIRRRVLDL